MLQPPGVTHIQLIDRRFFPLFKVCSLMKRPEEMHELMLANPAMKELIEANPEITQMMHNKELMATIANLAHNPAMLQVH